MNVRLYDVTATNGGPPGVLVQELFAMLASGDRNAIAAAVRFYTIINWAGQYQRLPYGGTSVNYASHTQTVMKPAGILLLQRKSKHQLYYSFISGGPARSSEMRAVLAANGTVPFPNNLTASIVRHNFM
jgi:hypothetical protein